MTIPVEMIRLAAKVMPETKKAAMAALKEAGLKQKLAPDVLEAVRAIKLARFRREHFRIARKLGFAPLMLYGCRDINMEEMLWLKHKIDCPFPDKGQLEDGTFVDLESIFKKGVFSGYHWRDIPRGKPGTLAKRGRPILPEGTPAERIARRIEQNIKSMFRAAYRVAAHGSISIKLTDDPAAVGVEQTEEIDWNGYARSCQYPMRRQQTAITVPKDWHLRVRRRGLALAGGMLTLDAAPLEGAPEGVEVFAAKWVEQGRGTSVKVVDGYIARTVETEYHNETEYHGETPEAALAGLKRKLKKAQWNLTLARIELPRFIRRLPDKDLDTIKVCVQDARAIGACEYGIRSWCHATGLDDAYAAGHATLRQMWQAYQAQPRTEARATILHALNRVRRKALLDAA
jgi:hypothetical protein